MVAVVSATSIGSGGAVGTTRDAVGARDATVRAASARNATAAMDPDSGRCRVRVVSQRRLRMLDGRIPYVASFSEAWRDGAGLFMGQPVFLFDEMAGFSEQPIVRDSLIGLHIDTSGIARPVVSPLTGEYSLYPRVVNSAEGGWEVILVRSPAPDSAELTPDSPAEIWSGHFDGRRWSAVTRVEVTRAASLRPEFTSRLVRNDVGELAFAYPLHGLSPTAGIVLLRRIDGRWRADSLVTPARVDYVGVEPSLTGRGWTLVYRMPNLSLESFSLGTISTVSLDSAWQVPRVVIHGEDTRFTDPVLVRVGDELIASWWQRPGDALFPLGPIGTVRWVRVDSAEAKYAPQASIAAREGTEFRLVSLGRHTALWVLRDFTRASHVSFSAWHGGVAVELGPFALTNDTGMSVVARDDSTASMLSSRFGRGAGEPPITSMLTTVSLRCKQ